MGAWPVRTARKISSPLNSEPLGWVTISSLPPVFCLTISANLTAVSEW